MARLTLDKAVQCQGCRYWRPRLGATVTSVSWGPQNLVLQQYLGLPSSSKGRICMKATGVADLVPAHYEDSRLAAAPALVCVPTTATSVDGVLKDIEAARQLGADVVELRLDFQKDLDLNDPGPQIQAQLQACSDANLPAIVTLRPDWEGGQFTADEPLRLAILKYASTLQPAYIDVELLAADFFFSGAGTVPIGTNVILSHHDFDGTPSDDELDALVKRMMDSGADIAKIAANATDISDSIRMLRLAQRTEGPTIALTMGEKGVPARLLATKFGSHLTFGCLESGKGSAPGQPTVQQLLHTYRLPQQTQGTKLFGVIGNPVSHSRSPALHNAALQACGIDAVYVPLLVDDLPSFLDSIEDLDFQGFSITIPHKLAALKAAGSIDPVAAQIGAVNTLVRQPDGSFKGYNTDWSAAINAVEDTLRENPQSDCDPEGCSLDFGDEDDEEGMTVSTSDHSDTIDLDSPLKGQRVVVIGSGGAGRALAFGAASRGAHVIIANRSRQKAEELAAELGGSAEVADLEAVQTGRVSGNILMNSTSVGMHPSSDESPMNKSGLAAYHLVFDAIYTPVETRLLKEAEECGCLTLSGLEMFIGQAAEQFELFTGQAAPLNVIRESLLKSL